MSITPTPGMRSPFGSVIVPVIEPRSIDWPHPAAARKAISTPGQMIWMVRGMPPRAQVATVARCFISASFFFAFRLSLTCYLRGRIDRGRPKCLTRVAFDVPTTLAPRSTEVNELQIFGRAVRRYCRPTSSIASSPPTRSALSR